MSVEYVMKKSDNKRKAEMAYSIKYHIGAHNNYVFFWEGLAPINEGGYFGPISYPDLDEAINKSFGDLDTFKKRFSA